jgi:glycosyltransferase involved in cell wall biosynthesis
VGGIPAESRKIMKILFAIKTMEDGKGGAERVLADITSGLADRGHDISVLTFDREEGVSFYPLNKKIRCLNLGIGNTYERSTLVETCARIISIRRAVKAESPDVVVPFMHSMFVPVSFALAGTGIPVVASEHIVPEYYKTRRFEFLLFLASSLFVQRITVLSTKVKAMYPRMLRKKMIVIENPVHEALIQPSQGRASSGRKVILNVGRLNPQKDQETLIKAFAKLATVYPEWDLRIIGEGELRAELEQLVGNLNLKNRIFLPGTTQNIAAEYQNADIFALPSRYESFGLATAEAMTHGLPVIGFADCPGTNELIVDNENGFLVDGENRIDAFTAALEKMITSPDLRIKLGEQGRQIVKKYQPEAIIEKWENLVAASIK